MFAYCQNSPVSNYDPSGCFKVNLQNKDLEGGIGGPGGGDSGGAGGGAILWGFVHLLESGQQELVNLTSLLALVQTLKFSSNNGEYFVYVLYNTDKNIQYVGRTKNPDARERAHKLNPNRKDLTFQIVGYNLNYLQVRGLEQVLMLYCHTIDKSNKSNNQINGVSPNNKFVEDYIGAAQMALGYTWNQFSNEVLCWLGQ